MFVAIEGLHCSGKTTIGKRLEMLLDDTVYTREVGGTPGGEIIRDIFFDPRNRHMITTDSKTELLLINASRRENLLKNILPALNKEPRKRVVCDRYLASSYAYQCTLGGVDEWILFGLHKEFAFSKHPDLYIYIDIEPIVSLERSKDRGGMNGWIDGADAASLKKLEKIGKGYKDFGKMCNTTNRNLGHWHTIDGSMSEVDVFAEVLSVIDSMESMIHSGVKNFTDQFKCDSADINPNNNSIHLTNVQP